MTIQYFLVDVSSITSKVARSQFSEAEIDRIAETILETGVAIEPILLRQLSPLEYEVAYGDLTYHAAARAQEIDPDRGEMVSAFVASEKVLPAAIRQAEFFAARKGGRAALSQGNGEIDDEGARAIATQIAPEQTTSNPNLEIRLTNVELRLTNIESRMDRALVELREQREQDRKWLEREVAEIRKDVPRPIAPLEAFNTLESERLAIKLKQAGIPSASQVAQNADSARQKGEFKSLSDVVKRVRGLSAERMLQIAESGLGS